MPVTINTTSGSAFNNRARIVFRNPRGQQRYYVIDNKSVSSTLVDIRLWESIDGMAWTQKAVIESVSRDAGTLINVDLDFIEDNTNSQLIVFYIRGNLTSVESLPIIFKRIRIADSDSMVTIGATQTVDAGGVNIQALTAVCRLDRNNRLIIAYSKNTQIKGKTFRDIVVKGTLEAGISIPDAPTFNPSIPTKVLGFDPSTDANTNDIDKRLVLSDLSRDVSGTVDGEVFAIGGRTGIVDTFDIGSETFTFNGTSFTFSNLKFVAENIIHTQSTQIGILGTIDNDGNRHLIRTKGNVTDVNVTSNKASQLATSYNPDIVIINTASEGAVVEATMSLEVNRNPNVLHYFYRHANMTDIREKRTLINVISWSTSQLISTEAGQADQISASRTELLNMIHLVWKFTGTLRYHEFSTATVQTLTQNARIQQTVSTLLSQNAFITESDSHMIEIFPELGVLAFIDLEIHHAIRTESPFKFKWIVNDSFDKEVNEEFRKIYRKVRIFNVVEHAEFSFVEDITDKFD